MIRRLLAAMLTLMLLLSSAAPTGYAVVVIDAEEFETEESIVNVVQTPAWEDDSEEEEEEEYEPIPTKKPSQNSSSSSKENKNTGSGQKSSTSYYPKGVPVEDPTDLYVLVNKENYLPSDYVPADLSTPNVPFKDGVVPERKQMREEAARALERMFAAAAEEGLTFLGVSGYRSYGAQSYIYNTRLEQMGEAHVSRYNARPGRSEHQTGLAMDLGCPQSYDLSQNFAYTPEYHWLVKHAHEFGFIIRYPDYGEAETGYAFEPWHVRYLGDRAAEVYESGLTYEAYLKELKKAVAATATPTPTPAPEVTAAPAIEESAIAPETTMENAPTTTPEAIQTTMPETTPAATPETRATAEAAATAKPE